MLTSNGYRLDEGSLRMADLSRTPPAERDDREALWRRLRAQGYLFLPRQLDPEAVLAFRAYYFESLRGTGLWDENRKAVEGFAGATPVDQAALRHQLFKDIVPSSTYQRFCTQPGISGWFRWFLGDEVHLHRRKILRHTRPGENGVGTATQAHYDLVYLREGTDRVLSMWIPLGDCPLDLGGLTYLEGSHHRVLAEEEAGTLRRPAASITADLPSLAERYDTRWLTAEFAAGDVVIHSAYLIHAALDNTREDGRMRLSTDIRYQRQGEPIDWRWQRNWDPDDGL